MVANTIFTDAIHAIAAENNGPNDGVGRGRYLRDVAVDTDGTRLTGKTTVGRDRLDERSAAERRDPIGLAGMQTRFRLFDATS